MLSWRGSVKSRRKEVACTMSRNDPFRALSPRSVLDPLGYDHLGDDRIKRSRSVGSKRKLPAFEPSASINLRHRLVCDETIEWLATSVSSSSSPASSSNSSSTTTPRVEELWLGPVFESSETVLAAISTLPTSVTHLDLDLRNALHLLPRALPLLFSRRHLRSLSVRVFGDAGAMELSQWLGRNPNLEKLDLRGNRIGSLGARTIADALIASLGSDHKLLHLNLSCNCILHGDFVGQLLTRTTTLRSLDLSFNWLGNLEVHDICQGLQRNTSLRELNLYGCQRISHEGMEAILDCLQRHNSSIESIQIQAFDDKGKQLVLEINHWLSLNKAGRYLLKSLRPQPSGLWPLVLERSNDKPDSLFYLLRQGSPRILTSC
jgi:Leucine Rich repeat